MVPAKGTMRQVDGHVLRDIKFFFFHPASVSLVAILNFLIDWFIFQFENIG